MGEDAMLYAINKDTEEKFLIGKEIPQLAPGGVINKKIENFEFSDNYEVVVSLKKITKKRFIKLLMSKGYQRNKAIKMQNEYIKKHKVRSRIGLEIFIMTYEIKPNDFKIKVGGIFL